LATHHTVPARGLRELWHDGQVEGNTNDLPEIRQLSAPQLKRMMDEGTSFELVDVRTEDERAVAAIEGARLLDKAYHDYLLGLDRDRPMVFQCHHGIRSQSAAEYFLQHGFRNLYNLRGGIDEWSRQVDPLVPRY
jgi:monothiol glutaredoxin